MSNYKFKLFNLECGNEGNILQKDNVYSPILFDTIEEAIAFRNNPDESKMAIHDYETEIVTEYWIVIVVEEEELKTYE